MAGFRKAKAEQAALKIGLYGAAGAGKTTLALLIAEGLAKASKKRIAFIDTERGTDFYAIHNKARIWHPEAFDFDALYTRSLTEVSDEVRKLKTSDYGVVVIDSITHLWETARSSYSGRTGPDGQIPMAAWGKIKKPYKDLIAFLLSSPMHVIICGRQGNDFDEDEDGKMKKVGVKMKAEGETAYEPHVLIRVEAVRHGETSVPTAFVEKDRSSCLSGRIIEWPTFSTIAEPMLHLLGDKQATIQTEDAAAVQDAAALADQDADRRLRSTKLFTDLTAKLEQCKTLDAVEAFGKEITPANREVLGTTLTAELREKWTERRAMYA